MSCSALEIGHVWTLPGAAHPLDTGDCEGVHRSLAGSEFKPQILYDRLTRKRTLTGRHRGRYLPPAEAFARGWIGDVASGRTLTQLPNWR